MRIVCLILFMLPALCLGEEIHIVTYEAPPFIGEDLPDQGAAIFAIRELFRKSNHTLKLTYAPFLRCRQIASKNSEMSGFFPAAYVNLTSDFVMSKIIFHSPWMLAERKDHSISWKTPEDLIPYRLGNVRGIDMEKSFQKLHAAKKLTVEDASSDELNLLKLATHRLDMVFIDGGVFEFLLKTSDKLKPYRDQLQLNPHMIHLDEYGVAFKKNSASQRHLKDFNSVATEEEFTRLVELYFKKHPPP